MLLVIFSHWVEQVKESLMLEAATDPSIENSAPVQDQVTMWEQIAMVEFGAGRLPSVNHIAY